MAKTPRQEFRFTSEAQKKDLKTLGDIRGEPVLNRMIQKAVADLIEHNREAIDHHREQKRLKREAAKLNRI